MTRNIIRRQQSDGMLIYDGDSGECILKVYNYPGTAKWINALSEVIEAITRGYTPDEVAATIREMFGRPGLGSAR